MAGVARGDVEILVHTTAPSRGLDDARYRALAQAYLDFEPVTRQRLELEALEIPMEELDRQADSQLQVELALSTQEERESRASYRPDDEEDDDGTSESRASLQPQDLDLLGASQPLESPELSFNSAINNADSPVFRELATWNELAANSLSQRKQTQTSLTSWEPPRSVISDSQPDQQGPLSAFASPATVLELYMRNFDGSRARDDSRKQEDEIAAASQSSSYINRSLTSKRARNDLSSPIEFQSSPSPNKSPTGPSNRIFRNMDDSMSPTQDPVIGSKGGLLASSSEDLHVSSSAPSRLAGNLSCFQPQTVQPPNRHRTESPSSEPDINSDAIPSSKATELATSSAESPTSPWTHLLEIQPSPPMTSASVLTAEMLITNHLHKLSEKMSLAILYQPISQTRDLRPMERGHWIVNCQDWNNGLRKRFWDCLGNFVGKNMAGWGVWCIRSEDHGTMRVYCWGIIVGHIYLLLYLASESKIKGVDAQWIGGDGQAVIRMKS